MIIGVTGPIGNGKDTVALYLQSQYGFERISFATALKDALSVIFHWDREALEGITPQSREWRETVDPWWAQALDIPHFTPRWAMLNIGTDVMRKHFHPDIWVHAAMRRAQSMGSCVVVSDVRFPNEAQGVRNRGGALWRVIRQQPSWWNLASQACHGDRSAQAILASQGVHESEWRMSQITPDQEISNQGSLEELYHQVDRLISKKNNI